MKAEVRMVEGLSFVGRADSNHWVPMDGPPELGGAGGGTRPLELLLLGLGGCTGMDVVSILKKKRATLASFRIDIEADRAVEHPKVLTKIKMTYRLHGAGLMVKDVEEAIALSREKYCAVAAMLSRACEIIHDYVIE